MGEIKNPESSEIKKGGSENFTEIKPEKGMTPEKAKEFWDNKYEDMQGNQKNGEPKGKQFFDDSGKLYRTGNELEPDATIEKDGYTYKTDDQGRVISAEGTLRIPKDPSPRKMSSMEAVSKGDHIKGVDEIFHLIGRRFGGSDGIENLVAGNMHLNRSDYARMENKLEKALKEKKDVTMKVEPVYDGDSNRPSEICVTYSINGEKETVVFKNEESNKNE